MFAHRSPRPPFWPLLLALSIPVLPGCAGKGPSPPADEFYRQAVDQAKRGRHLDAQHLFEEVRDADTSVRLEFLAEIGIADSLYKQGKFEQAAVEYAHLFEIHSGDSIADYLKYQLGMCFYRRIDTIDRDQGLTRKARSQFMELATRYPDSDLVPAAREHLQVCNDYLAQRDLYVGNYYFQKGNYRAAKARFERGVKDYGRVAATPELLHRIALAQYALHEDEAARKTGENLAAEYPDSHWSRDLPAAMEALRQRQARESQEGEDLFDRARRWLPGGNDDGEEGEDSPPPAEPASSPRSQAPLVTNPTPVETALLGNPTAAENSPTDVAEAVMTAAPDRAASEPWPGSTVALASPPTAADEIADIPPRTSRWSRLWSRLPGTDGDSEASGKPKTVTSVATIPTTEDVDDPGSPESIEPPSDTVADRRSPWERLRSWLHGEPEERVEEPTSRPATVTPVSRPGLVVRRIPPVPPEGSPATTSLGGGEAVEVAGDQGDPTIAGSGSAVRWAVPHPPEEAMEPETVSVKEIDAEIGAEEQPAVLEPDSLDELVASLASATNDSTAQTVDASPKATAKTEPMADELAVEELPAVLKQRPPEELAASALVTTDDPATAETDAVPETEAAAGDPVGAKPPAPQTGSLVVEDFSSEESETAGGSLEIELEAPEATTQRTATMVAEGASPNPEKATRPRGNRQPTLDERVEEALRVARPVPTGPQGRVIAVSGKGTRHQPPSPIPLPAYTQPTPLLTGEEPARRAATADDRPVHRSEWLPLTAVPPTPPTAGEPTRVEREAEREVSPKGFWEVLRASYEESAQAGD